MIRRLAFLALVLAATNAYGIETFIATIAPAPGATGASGSGEATLTLNDDETEVAYSVTFQGLTGPEVAAHIHRPDGSVALQLPLGSPKQGSWQNPGLIDVLSLKGELLYILIHTNQNPGGELRGNIVGAVPVENSTWGAIKAVYGRGE